MMVKYRRRFATGVLSLTLIFGGVACGAEDEVDKTEDQVEDEADDLEDKADELEEDVRENTP